MFTKCKSKTLQGGSRKRAGANAGPPKPQNLTFARMPTVIGRTV